MQSGKYRKSLPVCLLLICILMLLLGYLIASVVMNQKLKKYVRLQELDAYIQKNYYLNLDDDTEQAVMDSMLKGYVEGLDDRYSQYMTAEEYASFLTKESGKTVGIGVTVVQNADGYPQILEVQQHSPAEEAGLQVDDVLLAVDGNDIVASGYLESIASIKGEENTSVSVTVLRDGTQKAYEIVRRTFDVLSVQGQMLEDSIGYVRITNFRENTVEQFLEMMADLQEAGATRFIFDVRDNGGGLLDALEQILDPLLPEGVIATATYHGGVTEHVVVSDAEELAVPMVVLVNGNSASAAELFAASLRDFRQAKLVGTQTFGKGVMQVTTQMSDGGALSLTVATYQTAVSECYQGTGLTPDVVIEAGEAFILTNQPDPAADAQLAAAIATLQEME